VNEAPHQAIDALFLEERRSAPTRAGQGGQRPAGHLRPGLRGVLGQRGPRARQLVHAVRPGLRVGSAVCPVVPGRSAQRLAK
jgi:hypothetical protein